MKKVLFIFLAVAGSYGLAFGQQSAPSTQQDPTKSKTQEQSGQYGTQQQPGTQQQGTQQQPGQTQRGSGMEQSDPSGKQQGTQQPNQTQRGSGMEQSDPTQKTQQPGQTPAQTQRGTQQPGQSGMEQQRMADEANWEKIGETTIDPKKSRDEVAVKGKYKAIKIKSMETPVTLSDVEVEFDSGDNQELNLESTPIEARGESQVINLNTADRTLKKIHFGVKNPAQVQGEKAKIEIWGLKDEASKK